MRRVNDQDGNVVVITALLATTLFGLLALTVDVGALLVRDSSLQTGADAAALAVAKRCANAVVYGTTTCDDSIVQGFFDENALEGDSEVDVDVALHTSYEGKVGRVTVTGTASQRSYFSQVLNDRESHDATATATALWGPLTAVDEVFPLAVCKGALPPVGQSVSLRVDPASPALATCDGAVAEPSFGWITPDDPDWCTSKVSLLPRMYLDVGPASEEPTSTGCDLELSGLHGDIDSTAVCHTTPNEPEEHCHGQGEPEDRYRTLAVYDAASGLPSSRPAYALVSLEFTAARLGNDASTSASGWKQAACEPTDEASIPEVQCIEGIVRNYMPPTDGPIFDPAIAAALPDIDATTVLDVRLVD